MSNFGWECPYCKKSATIAGSNYSSNHHVIDINSKDGTLVLHTSVITCPNRECKEYEIKASLYLGGSSGYAIGPKGAPILSWSLRPQSKAKSFPDYIPIAILSDYEEACLISNVSPKASATLSRRCLQGMIRDFFAVSGRTLFDEISLIEDKVDPLTWAAIDAVRRIGNIGAHMEKDINVIVDVDENEADLLIGLIESLVSDWYIVRYDREKRLKAIVGVAADKKIAKKTD